MGLREVTIAGIKGKVLVKKIGVSRKVWDKINDTKNPNTMDYFLCQRNVLEIPLNDFFRESCYGDMDFFADEINSALTDGAELLWVEEES